MVPDRTEAEMARLALQLGASGQCAPCGSEHLGVDAGALTDWPPRYVSERG